MKLKNKTAINLVVDLLGYIAFLVLVGTGIIVAF